MNDNDDAALRARFAALRERDAAEQPAFELPGSDEAMRASVVRRRIGRRWTWATGGVLAAVGVALWLALHLNPPAPEPTLLVLPGWRTPTDSLLAAPTDPLMRASWASLPSAEFGRDPSPTAALEPR